MVDVWELSEVNKWFFRDTNKDWLFNSNKTAKSIEDAWEKTFTKWLLIAAGYNVVEPAKTCGLCNYYGYCNKCPVGKDTGNSLCEGSPYDAFLNDDPLSVLAEIIYLCRVYREYYKPRKRAAG